MLLGVPYKCSVRAANALLFLGTIHLQVTPPRRRPLLDFRFVFLERKPNPEQQGHVRCREPLLLAGFHQLPEHFQFSRFHPGTIYLQASHRTRRAPRGGCGGTPCIVSQVADMPQPWQRAMALPLTFTTPSGAGFSRSRVKRRVNRYPPTPSITPNGDVQTLIFTLLQLPHFANEGLLGAWRNWQTRRT